MPQLNAYLNFPGTCREAMTFYQQCLGGELTLMPFEQMPGGPCVPAGMEQGIMHSHLTSGALMFMASDDPYNKVVNGTSVSLSLNCDSEAQAEEYFAKLSAGGQVTMPLADQFWGAKFGMLTDKFGISWMLNYDKPKA